ncbi:PaaX family transcriptional regulator C-terminal domain-containing protein [Micromonospora sp. WMMD1120]|uniref:PaaX family transcriptional regulator n=1 Tax=Micromonospora sp. WMMD1120 TaxID=3016106 RepID=UPI0024177B8D|nr:PaaX family transcriptional regulator C-terminal domain-containing protein [Micromonospora sp. WMMD1120]MDG4808781.1 PaaX family transcriptional regulator C-terminal domain-containing protein [Micromonospora sp. WMMD1120]
MDAREPADDVRAPRAQVGSSPQHLLTTVLGEYLDSADADLPSTAIIAILAEFGVSEASARAALSRLVKRGLIAVRGRGRPPVYHLTPTAIARHRTRMRHFLSFGARPPRWTGEWLLVSFSIPSAGQAARHAVRRTLGALRFVGLYDSVWIRPGSDAAPVREALDEVLRDADGARWSVLHVRFDEEAGPHGPASAYDLTTLASGYADFVARYAELRAAARAGTVTPVRALVARTSAMDSWRRFADLDPDLPAHLLPRHWPRQQARETFLDIHSTLGSLAEARLVEVATPHWPQAAAWITHFRVSTDPDHPEPTGGTRADAGTD